MPHDERLLGRPDLVARVLQFRHELGERDTETSSNGEPTVQRADTSAVLDVEKSLSRQASTLRQRIEGQLRLRPQPGEFKPEGFMIRCSCLHTSIAW